MLSSAAKNAAPAIEARGLCKDYALGGGRLCALRGVDLVLPQGCFAAVIGPSGSGKSTLLSLLGCLDTPDAGSLSLFGRPTGSLNEAALAQLRGELLGFVFQSFNLLPASTALENVALPLRYRHLPATARRAQALAALKAVGLADRAGHLPGQLSGGQQQRVAVARALAMRPRLLLADEPTGSLDKEAAAEVFRCLEQLRQTGAAVLLVTHDLALAARAQLLFEMRAGHLRQL